MSGLPKGWEAEQLGSLADFVMGQAPPGTECNKAGAGVPFVKAGEFGDRLPIIREWTSRPLKCALASDVLICVVGATAGKINLGANCAIGRSVAAIRPTPALDQIYLYDFLATKVLQLRAGSVGSAQGVISKDDLAEVQIPLAPLPEQRRIVAKIDSLTAKSRRARDHLDHIPRLVEKYKQAILAAAFRGDLTREWRTEHGKHAPWQQVLLGDIADIQSGITLGKKRLSGAFLIRRPYLRVANVQRGWLKLDEIKEIEVTPGEAERLYLRPGDILMNEGGDRDKLGRGWVWEGQVADCIHQNHVFRVRLLDSDFPPKLVSLYANEFGQRHFFDEGTQTTNLASISKTKLSSLPIPLPPASEAVELLHRIETAFAWIDRLASEATSARKLIDRLDQAVLAKAFRGELVPQDPSDEPASLLLERIRAERGAAPKARRGRRPAVEA
ncbi:restriction endonuclease subunit S [Xanthobacter autotrophicus]|uniref:restriction endonuclease subunit S n=1 Tax=Xanthobacter autotrophicus TaxID=280 RepID=UPI00372B1A85